MVEVFKNIRSFEKWKELAGHYGFKCVYCGLDFLSSQEAYASAVLDHFKPKKLGGKEVVPSCRLCNTLKSDDDFKSIEKARRELRIRREKYFIDYEFKQLRAKYRPKTYPGSCCQI